MGNDPKALQSGRRSEPETFVSGGRRYVTVYDPLAPHSYAQDVGAADEEGPETPSWQSQHLIGPGF